MHGKVKTIFDIKKMNCTIHAIHIFTTNENGKNPHCLLERRSEATDYLGYSFPQRPLSSFLQ